MPVYVYVAALGVMGSVPLLWWAVAGDFTGKIVRTNLRDETVVHADLRLIELERSARERLVQPTIGALARRARRLTPGGLLRSLEHRIALAGVGGTWPIEQVLAAKLLLGAVGVVLGLLYFAGNATAGGLIVAAAVVGLCYFVPDLLLYSGAQKRQEAVERSLPDVLDQLTISVEAGLGFEAAMAQAGRSGEGPLAEELVRTLQDIQVGVPRVEALSNLLDRTNVPDLRHFVLAVRQAEQYGVPIAQVLRVQAKEMREKRRQRAEERAMKIPVKVVFPVVLCILPALMVVVIGPGAIRIYQSILAD